MISSALFNDNDAVVTWAIAHGCDVAAVNNEGTGLVQEALEAGARKSFPLLLAAKAPVNLRGHAGRTALHGAAERNNTEAAKALLAHGADATIADDEGNTPIKLAEGPAMKALLSGSPRAPRSAKKPANEKKSAKAKKPASAKKPNKANPRRQRKAKAKAQPKRR